MDTSPGLPIFSHVFTVSPLNFTVLIYKMFVITFVLIS